MKQRLIEAAKIGFKTAIIPAMNAVMCNPATSK